MRIWRGEKSLQIHVLCLNSGYKLDPQAVVSKKGFAILLTNAWLLKHNILIWLFYTNQTTSSRQFFLVLFSFKVVFFFLLELIFQVSKDNIDQLSCYNRILHSVIQAFIQRAKTMAIKARFLHSPILHYADSSWIKKIRQKKYITFFTTINSKLAIWLA